MAMRTIMLNYAGRPAEGLEEVQMAMRHNPHYPYWYLLSIGRALFYLERYEESVLYMERLVNVRGDMVPFWRALLAATYMALGREADARDEVGEGGRRPAGLNVEMGLHLPARQECRNVSTNGLFTAPGRTTGVVLLLQRASASTW